MLPAMGLWLGALAALAVALVAAHRLRATVRRPAGPLCTAAILGSGGHTAEMLALLDALPRDAYAPRVYLVSSGDEMSMAKARAAERARGALDLAAHPLQGLAIPRARAVGQSFLTTPITLAWSALFSAWHLGVVPTWRSRGRRAFADVVLMNGPATCVPVAAILFALRVLGAPTPRMVYIESFARVRSLSLSARILRHVVDRFVVQWPTADPHAACFGVLV